MLETFRMFAHYNHWANRKLYAAAEALPAEDLLRPTGAFFGSLLNTLNHILVADRIWLSRMTGTGPVPKALNEVPYPDFADLKAARMVEDERLLAFTEALDAAGAAGHFTYTPMTGGPPVTQRLAPALSHVFNHQTHHRGQCHMMLTGYGQPSLELDLIYFQRSDEGRRFA